MAERATKPVIFVHPEADTPEVRKLLRRAGYVVIVSASPPEHFRILPEVPVAPASILGRAAVETINQLKGFLSAEDVRAAYGKRVVQAVVAMGEAVEGRKSDA